jgi:hypothetical protein
VLTILGQEVNGVGLAQARGVEVAAQGFLVGKEHDNFLVRRGWGAVFQRISALETGLFANFHNVCYVKHVFLSTHCFH